MRLTKATHKAVEYACKHFHYAKAVPVNTIGYNVYNNSDEWCGVVLYGTGANPHIGNSYNLPTGGCVELVRVALNGKQESTSQAVAMSLKALKKDCPLIQLVISYADCDQNHLGTIYQATNWIYTGLNNEGEIAAFIVNGKKTHKKSIYSKMVIINGKKCTALKHWNVCGSILTRMQKFFGHKANENIYIHLQNKSENNYCHWHSRTRKLMKTGIKLTARNSKGKMLNQIK